MANGFVINSSAELKRVGTGLRVEKAYYLNNVLYDVQIVDSMRNLAAGDWHDRDLIRCVQGHWKCHLEQLGIMSYQKMTLTADWIVVDQKSYDTNLKLDAKTYAASVGAPENFEKVYAPLTSRKATEYFCERVLKTHAVAVRNFQPALPMMASVPSDTMPLPPLRPTPFDAAEQPRVGAASPEGETRPRNPVDDAAQAATEAERKRKERERELNLLLAALRVTESAVKVIEQAGQHGSVGS